MTDIALDEIRRRVIAKAEATGFLSVEDVDDVFAAASPSPSQVAPQPQAGEAVARPPFNFDRYVNGVLMAEDVTIERQTTLDDAMRAAASIASRGPNGEAPVLVYRPVASPQPANPEQVTDATDEAVRLAGDILMSHGLNAPEQVIYRAAREILETAAIGAGGQAVAEARKHDIKALIKLAGERQLVDGVTLYDRSLLKSLANVLEETLSQPHPADERVVEALQEARADILEWMASFPNTDRRTSNAVIAKIDAALSAKECR